MKHHHKQALYAGGFTALVFISMILYPKNVKAAELLILEGIKKKYQKQFN